jgi:hypothetical protein
MLPMEKSTRETFEQFSAMRDAWLMREGLNDVDPFIWHSPCYMHETLSFTLPGKAN